MENDQQAQGGGNQEEMVPGSLQTSATLPTDEVWASKIIARYLRAKSAEYRELSLLRQQGWDNPEGDKWFDKQRATADTANLTTSEISGRAAEYFYDMMKDIGQHLHKSTGVFNIPESHEGQPRVLDMCMAPGGMLYAIMQCNPHVAATAYSLPVEAGGHEILLPKHENIDIKLLDITMLVTDMGTTDVLEGHPDLTNFLPQQFSEDKVYKIALCDGQILRTHARAAYREHCEAHRLTATQLALALEHLRSGGTMIVLLHKLEAPGTLHLIHQFHQFSSIKVLKPPKAHAKRSSLYMVACDVQIEHPEAIKAVETWKNKKSTGPTSTVTVPGRRIYWRILVQSSSSTEDPSGPFRLGLSSTHHSSQVQCHVRSPLVSGIVEWSDRLGRFDSPSVVDGRFFAPYGAGGKLGSFLLLRSNILGWKR